MAESYIEYLYRALRSPAGICVRVVEGDYDAFRQKLYIARREACDPELENLQISQSPTDDKELWIVKKVGSNAGE